MALRTNVNLPGAAQPQRRHRFVPIELVEFAECLHVLRAWAVTGLVKCPPTSDLAEREGFEPSVQVLARTTV